MKKVIFTLSCIGLGLVSVSCSTDAYDLPETNELRVQQREKNVEMMYNENFSEDENNSSYTAKEGDEEDTSNTSNSTDPINGTKKD